MQLLSTLVTVATCIFSVKKSIEQKRVWPFAAFVAAYVGLKKLRDVFTPTPIRSIPDWKERKDKNELIEEITEWLKTPDASPKRWLGKAERLLEANFDHLADRHLLVIVCPAAGTGQARHYWKDVVRPILNAFGITKFTVKETEYVEHATEIIASINLEEYDAIAHLGGDGTAYEIFTGLYKRKEGGPRLDFPMAYFSCGSGNGTGSSVVHANPSLAFKGDFSLIDSCLTLAKWNLVPFDLTEFQIKYVDGKVLENLSQICIIFGNTGFMVKYANSIRWTKLGRTRYDLVAYWNWFKNYNYPIECFVLPEENVDDDLPTMDNWKVDKRWVKLQDEHQFLSFFNFWCFSPDPRRNNLSFSDGNIYIQRISGYNRVSLWNDCFAINCFQNFYHDVDEPQFYPEGMEMMRAKAVHCKFLGPKNDWKRKIFFYDGEFEDRYVDEFRMVVMPSVARVFSC